MYDFKDTYDGGNDSGGYYDEKKEKADRRHQAAIWLGLVLLFGGLLVFCVSKNVGEIIMKYNAHSVIGKFAPVESTVSFMDENGDNHIINIDGTLAKHYGDQMTLYYYNDDYSNAKTITWVWFWVFSYAFFGSIFLISLVLYKKNMKQTHHYKGIPKKYTY